MAQSTKKIPISIWRPAWSQKKKRQVPGVVPLDADLYDILYKIKNGGYNDIVLPLREITDPEQRKQYKTEKLPAITVSGQFRKPREESSLITHSGQLCIDIDPGANPDILDWAAFRDKMADEIDCVFCGLSCSGKGIFIIVKIEPERHRETFDYIAWDLAKDGIVIDPAPKNVASLRFVSYDPEAYINPNYDSINIIVPNAEFIEHKKRQDAKLREVRQQAKPVNSSNDIELFQNAKAEADAKGMKLQRGLGTPLIQFIVGYCNGRGMSRENCTQFFLEQYGTTDYYTAESITERIADMYERYEGQHGSIPLNPTYGKNTEISFFDIKKTNKSFQISVNRPRFIDLLHANGIYLYFPGGNSYVLCKITDCFIEEITTERIKKIVRDHVNSLPEKLDCGITRIELLDFLYKGSDNYFGRGQIEFIDRAEPDFLKDTKDIAYLPFRNGVVVITADKISLLPYAEVKQHLWRDSIIDFDIELNNSSRSGEWYKFYSCICGNDDPSKLTSEQADQFFYLLCLTGYLLHRYKDPGRPYAVILAERTETDEKGGGTGKGLYFKGLEKIARSCVIPGKSFDPNKPFALQRLKLQDTLIVIDDIPQKFLFESLYNLITEGAAREQKNQQEIFLPYEISPKIVLISNYVVSSSGDHAKRRQRVFEFAPFFSPRYTPEKLFGHILFNDWDKDEWNRFYNLQIACIMMYLKNGLPQSEKSDTLRRREVVQQYGKEFASWFFDYYTQNGCEKWHSAKELYDAFLQYSEVEKTDYSAKRFRAGIASASRTWGHDLQNQRNKSEGNRTEYRLIKRK